MGANKQFHGDTDFASLDKTIMLFSASNEVHQ